MRNVAIILTLVLAVAACGSDGDSTAPGSTPTTEAPTTTEPPATTTEAPATTTEAPPVTEPPVTTVTVPEGIPDIELPGEAFDLAPPADTVLAVLGVRHDDVLNVRVWPGVDGRIVATLAPTAADFTATGRARSLPNSIWWEVVVADGEVGWVSSRFTAVIGVAQDATAWVVDELGTVSGDSIEAVGLAVAESQSEGEATQRIEMVVAPTEGDLGEVVFDVAGLGDDAVAGLRLHIFVVDEAGDGTWTLRTVEATAMCQSHRGGIAGEPCP